MRTTTIYLSSIAAIALVAAACGESSPDADDLNKGGTAGVGAGSGGATAGSTSSGGTGGVGGATGGSGGVGGSAATAGSLPSGGSAGATAGMAGSLTAGVGGMAGGSGAGAMGGSAGGDPPMGGMAGTGAMPMGGAAGGGAVGGDAGAGAVAGMAGGGAGGGSAGTGPYDPRSGSFKMLVYSRTTGFRHDQSIATGKTMLQQIATEQDFEVTFTEENSQINAAGLAQYEIVFFMNSTGTIFNNTEKQAYEEWMTTKNGAFAGVHSATDTENGWAFYSEVTGQYYDLHDTCCAQANIQWDTGALDFVAVLGLPSPWQRSEEWYKFNQAAEWSVKPGFKVLSRVTTNNNTRPVSYIREWSNFRSFYTSLGHEGSAFQDADVKKHVTAGLMWAVRRDHLIQ